jgi:hypothetical protein
MFGHLVQRCAEEKMNALEKKYCRRAWRGNGSKPASISGNTRSARDVIKSGRMGCQTI